MLNLHVYLQYNLFCVIIIKGHYTIIDIQAYINLLFIHNK